MKGLFRRLTAADDAPFITVISGLPRSGTSMMMKMVEAGGIPPMTDALRVAGENNPKGYYEFEHVNTFLGGKLDTARRAGVVDSRLYRNRA